MLFKASAPGSVMLLGEHAVLHGHSALVCAINKRMTVHVEPRPGSTVELVSALGTHQTDITLLEPVGSFKFILATLKKFQKQLKQGCCITVESEFSDQVGLASSAAVTVATFAAVSVWLGQDYTPAQYVHHARRIVQSVQGVGSGADVAACVLGGMVAYRMQPFVIKNISNIPDITLMYSGHKTPTTEVIARVTKTFSAYPKLYKQLLQAIGHCAEQGIAAADRKNWKELGLMMNIQQGLMDALGVNTPILNSVIEELRSQPTVFGAKISGSGLGDCAVALGSLSDDVFPDKYGSQSTTCGIQQIDVNITTEGVRCEQS